MANDTAGAQPARHRRLRDKEILMADHGVRGLAALLPLCAILLFLGGGCGKDRPRAGRGPRRGQPGGPDGRLCFRLPPRTTSTTWTAAAA